MFPRPAAGVKGQPDLRESPLPLCRPSCPETVFMGERFKGAVPSRRFAAAPPGPAMAAAHLDRPQSRRHHIRMFTPPAVAIPHPGPEDSRPWNSSPAPPRRCETTAKPQPAPSPARSAAAGSNRHASRSAARGASSPSARGATGAGGTTDPHILVTLRPGELFRGRRPAGIRRRTRPRPRPACCTGPTRLAAPARPGRR